MQSKTKPASKITLLFVMLAFLAMLTACGGDGGPTPVPSPTPTPTPTPAPSADTTPDEFSFTAVADTGFESVVESEAATITGIDAASPISVTGGEYSIGDSDFTADAGTITNDQTVTVRLTTPDTADATAQATLDVGGVTATFDATNASYNRNLAVYAEAEGGQASSLISMGDQFTRTDDDAGYVSINETETGAPADDTRVIELEVTFPGAGIYELYTRLRVGPNGNNDDSFFAPDNFGSGNGWIQVNGITGFVAPGEPGFEANMSVLGNGPGQTESWSWHRLEGATYTVPDDALTQTFRFGGREDGLDIDKFAFSQENILYTTEQIDGGLAGVYTTPPEPPEPFTPEGPAIATGQDKFLGGVCCGAQGANFTAYWNQVTPENAGKWASAEGTRDVFNWGPLDEAYAMAKDNGFIAKMHVMTWGNQQPTWIADLSTEEQLEEIVEWYDAVTERYTAFDYVEVVNEFDNDPPNAPDDNGQGGNYIDALRLADPATTTELITQFMTAGEDATAAAVRAARYDWIINSFQMARDRFTATTKLMINEYSVINSDARTTTMMEIVELLKARNLIDAVGFQGHAFSTGGPNANMVSNIDRLATLGLDLYVTELDIDGPTDLIQLIDYQRLFPMLWEHPAIKGITVWGYLPGHWREGMGAHLALESGAEKPALVWLRGYVNGQSPIIAGTGNIGTGEELAADTAVGTELITLTATAAGNDAVEWSIMGGDGSASYAIDAATGVVTVAAALASGENHVYVQAKSGIYTSMLVDLTFIVPGDVVTEPPPPITYSFETGLDGWRTDFGTDEDAFTVVHDATAQAAVVTADWSTATQFLITFVPNSPLDYTGANIEYTVTVTQAQVDAGITARGVVQTGEPEQWTRLEGTFQALVAGENTFTYSPIDDANNNLKAVERVAVEFGGLQDSGNTDVILINNIAVTF